MEPKFSEFYRGWFHIFKFNDVSCRCVLSKAVLPFKVSIFSKKWCNCFLIMTWPQWSPLRVFRYMMKRLSIPKKLYSSWSTAHSFSSYFSVLSKMTTITYDEYFEIYDTSPSTNWENGKILLSYKKNFLCIISPWS